jgi:hypothetical protein
MGVDYRWQVESEDEWEVLTLPSRQRWQVPWRALAAVVLLLAVAAGVAGGVFWHRAREGEERLKRELGTIVDLEAQALRDGDRETFLSLQDEYDSQWYGRQEERFPEDAFSANLEPGQEASLAVLSAGMLSVEDHAWAEVAWALEDGVYRRAQFYRQVDGRWLRTGARREYYGRERTRETAHFAFRYLARDELTVDWMAEQLEAWHETVCADLGCDDDERINVLVTPDGTYSPLGGFTLNSPRLRGVREDGALLPEERDELARLLIYLLAARRSEDVEVQGQSGEVVTQLVEVYGEMSPTGEIVVSPDRDVYYYTLRGGIVEPEEQPYLLPQIVNWEMRRLGLAGKDTPPTPVWDAVMTSHGIEGVRALLAAMAQTTSEDEALRRALGVGLADLEIVFGQYLTALLALERQMMEWQAVELVEPTTMPLARQTFRALSATEEGQWYDERMRAFRNWPNQQVMYLSASRPLSRPAVHRWELLDDAVLWAEVAYLEVEWPFNVGRPLRKMEFFQRIDGAWRHAPPAGQYLGQEVTLNSEHFQIVCHEREEAFMASELVYLESLYQYMADALQAELPPGERLTIRITPSGSSAPGAEAVDVGIESPYLLGWWDEPGASYLASTVWYRLFERLASHATGLARPTGSRVIWWEIITGVWQSEIVGSEIYDWRLWLHGIKPFASAVAPDGLFTLSELGQVTFVSAPPAGWTNNWSEEVTVLFYIETATVVVYAGEIYGPQAFPALLRSLSEADSLEDWLQVALNVDLETFEAGWRVWLREAIALPEP